MFDPSRSLYDLQYEWITNHDSNTSWSWNDKSLIRVQSVEPEFSSEIPSKRFDFSDNYIIC
jgi:hypothetical protein